VGLNILKYESFFVSQKLFFVSIYFTDKKCMEIFKSNFSYERRF